MRKTDFFDSKSSLLSLLKKLRFFPYYSGLCPLFPKLCSYGYEKYIAIVMFKTDLLSILEIECFFQNCNCFNINNCLFLSKLHWFNIKFRLPILCQELFFSRQWKYYVISRAGFCFNFTSIPPFNFGIIVKITCFLINTDAFSNMTKIAIILTAKISPIC